MRKIVVGCVVLISSVGASAATSECAPFVDAVIVSQEGKFLGNLSNKYDSNSIFNKYGDHGSKYNSDSIWNKYGDYGGAYGSESAFNKTTSTPPLIIKDRKIIGRLTKNRSLAGAIDPTLLSVLCFDHTPE